MYSECAFDIKSYFSSFFHVYIIPYYLITGQSFFLIYKNFETEVQTCIFEEIVF